jgi:hypothetical protein
LIINLEKTKDDNLFDTHKIAFTEEDMNESMGYKENDNVKQEPKEESKSNDTENSQDYLNTVYGYINNANKVIYEN